MQIKNHYTILAYPFFHTLSDREGVKWMPDMPPHWRLWWHRLSSDTSANSNDEQKSHYKDEMRERALDDTYFFLPYVRHLLFPETAFLSPSDPAQQVPELRRLANLPLNKLAEQLNPYSMLRLTYSPEQLETLHPLRLEYDRKNKQGEILEQFSAPMRIGWADVALLPKNVGFLFLKVWIDEETPTVNRLNDFLYYVRQVHKSTVDWQLPNWRHTGENQEYVFKSQELVDFLLQCLTEGERDLLSTPIPTLHDWLDERDTVPRYSFTEMGQVYGQSFRLYTYACLDNSSPESENSKDLSASESTVVSVNENPQFNSVMEQTLYELATCTRTTDEDFMPHAIGVKQIMEKGHIALWSNWEAMALHDNVIFLGAHPTPFTCNVLAHNVESDYFHLYLLTLYQKMRLSILSGELMRRNDNLYQNLHEARDLWDHFMMFRNHYWFTEVTFKPQGTELYMRFQNGLNVLSLYDSVSNGVRELQDYYERKGEHEVVAGARKLQEEMAKNVEATKFTAERQVELAQAMNQNVLLMNQLQTDMSQQLKIIANIQKKVEWIEIFVVGFYTAELLHIIIALFEKEYHLELWWSTSLVLGSGFLTALFTWKMMNLKHIDNSHQPQTNAASVIEGRNK